jgi:hypothetical protein
MEMDRQMNAEDQDPGIKPADKQQQWGRMIWVQVHPLFYLFSHFFSDHTYSANKYEPQQWQRGQPTTQTATNNEDEGNDEDDEDDATGVA